MAVVAVAGLSAGRVTAPIRYGPAISWCAFVLALIAGACSIGLLHFDTAPAEDPPPPARALSGISPFWDTVGQQFEQSGVARTSEEILGPSPALAMNAGWQLVYGLATVLAVDLCFFLYHLMMHRTRIGWAIHKVYHSAEVLTPLTRYREHFLEAPIHGSFVTVGAMAVSGAFAWLFNGGITQITLMNMGLLSFVYALNANFRHYHICFRYPRWLEYWLQSPGMHHSHDSTLKKHWDSNLGLFTNIWDRLFGTLYIGEPFESTPWGLPEEQQARCSSLADNLLAPFREIGAMLRR